MARFWTAHGVGICEGDHHETRRRIRLHIVHTLDAHQRLMPLPHALVTFITGGRDLDRLQDLVISRVVEIMRIGWVHKY